jgi:pimeloyl-ACP methyl ester carboxylesterase
VVVAALAGTAYQWTATRNDLAASPAPGRLVDVGGHQLHIWCTGSGEPTVILENGLGGSTLSWSFVQPEVAKFTRVCSYDRAGMGYSDPGPSPRTARRIAQELAELLDHTGINGRLVLAGASIGGLFVRVFASEHGDRVGGLVLVDASHEDQKMSVPGITPFVPLLSTIGAFRLRGVSFGGTGEYLPPPLRGYARATAFRTSAYQATADEGLHWSDSVAEVKASRHKLAIPVVVVTAGRESDPEWQRLQRDQVGLSEEGCQIIADQSGHVVAFGQPQAIVNPIRAIVERIRGRKDVPLCGMTAS